MSGIQLNLAHGHVFPRPDGARYCCGGPAICSVCAKDAARKASEEGNPMIIKAGDKQFEAIQRRAITGQLRRLLALHGEALVCRAFAMAMWTRREALLETDSHTDAALAAICERAGNQFDELTREFDVFL